MKRSEFLKLSALGVGALTFGGLAAAGTIPKKSTIYPHLFDMVVLENEVICYVQDVDLTDPYHPQIQICPIDGFEAIGSVGPETPILLFPSAQEPFNVRQPSEIKYAHKDKNMVHDVMYPKFMYSQNEAGMPLKFELNEVFQKQS